MMQDNEQLRQILKEVSAVISESLSSPAVLQKLEFLRDNGYQLYLIMESHGEADMEGREGPVMPIQVGSPVESGGKKRSTARKTDMFALSKSDRDFLRTLKIRVD